MTMMTDLWVCGRVDGLQTTSEGVVCGVMWCVGRDDVKKRLYGLNWME